MLGQRGESADGGDKQELLSQTSPYMNNQTSPNPSKGGEYAAGTDYSGYHMIVVKKVCEIYWKFTLFLSFLFTYSLKAPLLEGLGRSGKVIYNKLFCYWLFLFRKEFYRK